MTTIPLDEAQDRLKELIGEPALGGGLVITDEERPGARPVAPMTRPARPDPAWGEGVSWI